MFRDTLQERMLPKLVLLRTTDLRTSLTVEFNFFSLLSYHNLEWKTNKEGIKENILRSKKIIPWFFLSDSRTLTDTNLCPCMVGAFLSLVALSRICTVVLLKVAPIGKAVCSEEIENRIFTFPIFFFFLQIGHTLLPGSTGRYFN